MNCNNQEPRPKRVHPYFHRLPIYNDGVKSINILGDGTVAVARHGCSCNGMASQAPQSVQVPKRCGKLNCGHPSKCMYCSY